MTSVKRQISQSWFLSEDNSRLRSLPQAKPALIWTPATLFKTTEILCDKTVSQKHSTARDFKAGKALCYKDSGIRNAAPPGMSPFPLDLVYIQTYFTVREGRCWHRCPQERLKLCTVALWPLSSVEAGRAACQPALLEALGLAIRGVRQEAGPLLSSQLSSVAASSKHNQIGNLYPVFSSTWLRVLFPRGLR